MNLSKIQSQKAKETVDVDVDISGSIDFDEARWLNLYLPMKFDVVTRLAI